MAANVTKRGSTQSQLRVNMLGSHFPVKAAPTASLRTRRHLDLIYLPGLFTCFFYLNTQKAQTDPLVMTMSAGGLQLVWGLQSNVYWNLLLLHGLFSSLLYLAPFLLYHSHQPSPFPCRKLLLWIPFRNSDRIVTLETAQRNERQQNPSSLLHI